MELRNAVAADTHLVGECADHMLAAEGIGHIRPALVHSFEVVAHNCLAADRNYPTVDHMQAGEHRIVLVEEHRYVAVRGAGHRNFDLLMDGC